MFATYFKTNLCNFKREGGNKCQSTRDFFLKETFIGKPLLISLMKGYS
jgi:hypothetical protein